MIVLDGSSTGTSETAALYEYGQLFHTLRTPGSHELDHTLRPAAPTDVIMMAMPRPNTDCSDALEPQCHGAAQNLCASGADMDVHSWKCNDDCCLKSQLVTTSAAHQGAAGGEVAWRSIRMEHEHGVAGLDSAGSDRFDATRSLKMNTLVAPSWLTNAWNGLRWTAVKNQRTRNTNQPQRCFCRMQKVSTIAWFKNHRGCSCLSWWSAKAAKLAKARHLASVVRRRDIPQSRA